MKTFNMLRLTDAQKNRMSEAIVAFGNDHLSPILKACFHGATIVIMQPNRKKFAVPVSQRGKGWIAMIADEFSDERGPSTFHSRSMHKLFQSAGRVYVVSTEPDDRVYASASEFAEKGTNIIIVETASDEELAWLLYAEKHAPEVHKVVVSRYADEYRRAVAN